MKTNNLERFYKSLFNTDRFCDSYEFLFETDECFRVKKSNYDFKCKKCGTVFSSKLDNRSIPRCPRCYPYLTATSKAEKEIADFCRKYYPNLIENDRTIIALKKLDIFIPEISVAIELNGLYLHGEASGTDPNYHLEKTNECNKNKIRLLHVYEDEWNSKKEVVESFIKRHIEVYDDSTNVIFCDDEDCSFSEIDFKEAYLFFKNNHLNDAVYTDKVFALKYGKDIVAVMLVNFKNKRTIQVEDIAVKNNVKIYDLYFKIQEYLKEIRSDSVVEIAEHIRFGFDRTYISDSDRMVFFRKIDPDCFYFNNTTEKIPRTVFENSTFKETVLESYDVELTEWENIQLNGYDRIWDCGRINIIFPN